MLNILEDIMQSSLVEAEEDIQEQIHSLNCKVNLTDLANSYYPYWKTNNTGKRLEIMQLGSLNRLSSNHRFIITLPERRGIFEIDVSSECNLRVYL